MKRSEKEMGEKMKTSLEAFYKNQFRRYEEVLTVENQAHVASCLCMFLSIFSIPLFLF